MNEYRLPYLVASLCIPMQLPKGLKVEKNKKAVDRRLSTGGSSPAWGPSILLPRGAVLPYFLQSHPSQTQVFLSVMFFLAWVRWSFVWNFSCNSWDFLYQRIAVYPFTKSMGKGKERPPQMSSVISVVVTAYAHL